MGSQKINWYICIYIELDNQLQTRSTLQLSPPLGVIGTLLPHFLVLAAEPAWHFVLAAGLSLLEKPETELICQT